MWKSNLLTGSRLKLQLGVLTQTRVIGKEAALHPSGWMKAGDKPPGNRRDPGLGIIQWLNYHSIRPETENYSCHKLGAQVLPGTSTEPTLLFHRRPQWLKTCSSQGNLCSLPGLGASKPPRRDMDGGPIRDRTLAAESSNAKSFLPLFL